MAVYWEQLLCLLKTENVVSTNLFIYFFPCSHLSRVIFLNSNKKVNEKEWVESRISLVMATRNTFVQERSGLMITYIPVGEEKHVCAEDFGEIVREQFTHVTIRPQQYCHRPWDLCNLPSKCRSAKRCLGAAVIYAPSPLSPTSREECLWTCWLVQTSSAISLLALPALGSVTSTSEQIFGRKAVDSRREDEGTSSLSSCQKLPPPMPIHWSSLKIWDPCAAGEVFIFNGRQT